MTKTASAMDNTMNGRSGNAAPQSESSPLLTPSPPPKTATTTTLPRHPHLFWIEAALFANVFLAGFDGTVTASTYAVISSEFRSANLASWISTAYLVTTTALQPLYGRLSDIFGRRSCLLAATTLFGLGCLGCGLSPDLAMLIAMRALAGAGGGGLMTMDLIPSDQRGMYQAVQNILHGVGSILGASLGGTIAGAVGWRFSFLLQVPVCVAAFVVARAVVPAGTKLAPRPDKGEEEPPAANGGSLVPGANGIDDDGGDDDDTLRDSVDSKRNQQSTWEQIDFYGAVLLIAGLSLLLAALSAGSSSSPGRGGLAWASPGVLGCLAGSIVLLGAFVAVEARTTAVPLLPLRMLHGVERVALLVANVCLGVSGYGFLFLMPLFFQAVLLDSASVAGLRLVASSLATPLGGLTTGLAMKYFSSKSGGGSRVLTLLARTGAAILLVGGIVNLALGMHDASWKYAVYLTVGGFGQGMSYPASLFSFIGACDFNEHAVATYLVYLVRSVGSVCGVAAISTIVQTSLATKLAKAFAGTPGGAELIDSLTHSVEALRDLPPDTQKLVQAMYYESCRTGLYFLLGVGVVTLICTLLVPMKRRV